MLFQSAGGRGLEAVVRAVPLLRVHGDLGYNIDHSMLQHTILQ